MRYLCVILLVMFCNVLSAQLVLEKDINTEPGSSDPRNFAQIGDVIYFIADDGVYETEIHQYNIVTGEHRLAVDTRTKEGKAVIEFLTVSGDVLYFSTQGDQSSVMLHSFDPSTEEFEAYRIPGTPRWVDHGNFYAYNGKIFLHARTSSLGGELFIFDTSTKEYRFMGDINPGAGGSNPRYFTEAGGTLYFSANNGENTSKIYYFDVESDTIKQYMYVDSEGTYAYPQHLTAYDDKLFYSDKVVNSTGRLRILDLQTNECTLVDNLNQNNNGDDPFQFTPYQDKLFFTSRSKGINRSLFAYDSETGEVGLELTTNPDGNSSPYGMVEVGDYMYFQSSQPDGMTYMYRYDEVTDDYTVVGALEDDLFPGRFTIMGAAGQDIFMEGFQSSVGNELLKFDTESEEFAVAADINKNNGDADPTGFTPYKGKLYFTASEYLLGDGLWSYDPASGFTERVKSNGDDFSARSPVVLGDRLYFTGVHPTERYGLNYYDSETDEVVATAWRSPSCSNCMQELTAYNGKLYMSAQMDDAISAELYEYDPATDTGRLVADLNPNGRGGPQLLTLYNDGLMMRGTNGEGERVLFRYSFADESLEQVSRADGSVIMNPNNMIVFNGVLYGSGDIESSNEEIFSYETDSGVARYETNHDANMRMGRMVPFENKLFFGGNWSSVGRGLVSFDPDGSVLTLEHIPEEKTNSIISFSSLTEFDGALYYVYETDEFGEEIWTYKEDQSQIVADIYPGPRGSKTREIINWNNKLYLSAENGLNGTELWSYASCINAFVDTDAQMDQTLGAIDLTVSGGTPPYIYEWNTGANSEDLGMVAAGNYSVIVRDQSGCIITLNVVVDFLSHTDEAELTNVLIYPNPSNGRFQVESVSQIRRINVYSIDGRLTRQLDKFESEGNTVDLSSSQSGTYILQVYTDAGVEHLKVSVQR